jgi:hypothetical protein
MRLWKGNKVDQQYEMSDAEIFATLKASRYFELLLYYPTRRVLAMFISAPDGLNSTWEEAEFERLVRYTDNELRE